MSQDLPLCREIYEPAGYDSSHLQADTKAVLIVTVIVLSPDWCDSVDIYIKMFIIRWDKT